MSLVNEKIDWYAIENSNLDPLYAKMLSHLTVHKSTSDLSDYGTGFSPYISLHIKDVAQTEYSSIREEYTCTSSIDIIYNSVVKFYNSQTAFLCIYDQKSYITKLMFIITVIQDLHEKDSGQLIYCCDDPQKRLALAMLLYKLDIPFGLTKIKRYGDEERVFISNSNLCKNNNKRVVVVTNTGHLPHIMRSPVLRHLSILCLDDRVTSHNYTRLDIRYPKYVISLVDFNKSSPLQQQHHYQPVPITSTDLYERLESKICKYCLKVKVIAHNDNNVDIYDLNFQNNVDKSLPPKETSLSELSKYFHSNR